MGFDRFCGRRVLAALFALFLVNLDISGDRGVAKADVVCLASVIQVTVTAAAHQGLPSIIYVQATNGSWTAAKDIPSNCGSSGQNSLYIFYNSSCWQPNNSGYLVLKICIESKAVNGSLNVTEYVPVNCPITSRMSLGDLALYSCDIQASDAVPCGDTGINETECVAKGCCFDSFMNTSCYYSNQEKAECTQDGNMVIVINKDVTKPALLLDSVSLSGGTDPPCNPVIQNPSFLLFKFPLDACGTELKMVGNNLVYETEVTGNMNIDHGKYGSITRDTTYRLTVRCNFSAAMFMPAQLEVFTLAPPLPAMDQGPLRMELRIAKEESYGSYYTTQDYPITKLLQQPVYVEVALLGRTDPNITLVLDNCWATSTPSPYSEPHWDLLENGCSYHDDPYLTLTIPVTATTGVQFPKQIKRFVLRMFTFIDHVLKKGSQNPIYLYCSAAACYPSAEDSCTTTCITKSRHIRNVDFMRDLKLTHSGPIVFQEDESVYQSWFVRSNPWIVLVMVTVVAVAVATPILIYRRKTSTYIPLKQ
ncbi:zona pellucida sperm-binding protein 4-like [Erpetoichthys calabaricus]|nr:zona pellucida sperm-binding protein 4-like [Erpetoichthys calabaricus]